MIGQIISHISRKLHKNLQAIEVYEHSMRRNLEHFLHTEEIGDLVRATPSIKEEKQSRNDHNWKRFSH